MKNSTIAWTNHTFNPWIGCSKVSPGCSNCYAEVETFARTRRAQGTELWGKGQFRHRTSTDYWKQPIKWNVDAAREESSFRSNPLQARFEGNPPPRPRIFCASMSDWLDDEVPIEWLADLLSLIHRTPNLNWLMLTKRPENWFTRVRDAWLKMDGGSALMASSWLGSSHGGRTTPNPPDNVWMGTSVEDQTRANQRIPTLITIPARIRFLSVEPMLGPIDFPTAAPCGYYCDHDANGGGHRPGHGLSGIHWVIFGGESGPNARHCHIQWLRDGIAQCRSAGVSVFVKQLGSNSRHDTEGEMVPISGPLTGRANVNISNAPLHLHHPKGGDPAEWPKDLQIREFPH